MTYRKKYEFNVGSDMKKTVYTAYAAYTAAEEVFREVLRLNYFFQVRLFTVRILQHVDPGMQLG